VGIGGTADKLATAKTQFIGVLVIALIISFLLLAGLFEDFLAPVVVLVVIPFAAVGGVLALRLVDTFLQPQPLDLISAVGFLILIGVVVNNSILIVDGALARLRKGTELNESISEAVRDRVRPIFMSTMTSLAGLAPMIFITGEGSELYRGVGSIVLGGLALSTVLALFIVPALFSVVWRIRRAVANVLA
jgi:HAE1 family hydrophobic/amphiphilic exporter-1